MVHIFLGEVGVFGPRHPEPVRHSHEEVAGMQEAAHRRHNRCGREEAAEREASSGSHRSPWDEGGSQHHSRDSLWEEIADVYTHVQEGDNRIHIENREEGIGHILLGMDSLEMGDNREKRFDLSEAREYSDPEGD